MPMCLVTSNPGLPFSSFALPYHTLLRRRTALGLALNVGDKGRVVISLQPLLDEGPGGRFEGSGAWSEIVAFPARFQERSSNRTQHQRHLKQQRNLVVREFSVLNGLEWIVLTAAVLGVFVVGDLVLCGGHAYCRQFRGRQ
jgi:hypothetical protein